MSLSTYSANALLDHTFRNVSWSTPTAWWVQLHYGDPGSDGTQSAWGPPTVARKPCSDWETSSYGWLRNTAAILWEGLPSPGVNENIGYATIWDALSGGNCIAVCWLETQATDSPTVRTGDSFLIPAYHLFIPWVGP